MHLRIVLHRFLETLQCFLSFLKLIVGNSTIKVCHCSGIDLNRFVVIRNGLLLLARAVEIGSDLLKRATQNTILIRVKLGFLLLEPIATHTKITSEIRCSRVQIDLSKKLFDSYLCSSAKRELSIS